MSVIKIAAVTDDGRALSSHFGMAKKYIVITLEDGKVTTEETREKAHHAHHPDHDHGAHEHHNHDEMFAPIRDCQVLLCGGMGTPAYQKAVSVGLDVVMTGGPISDAVRFYADGTLLSDSHRVHQH